MKKFTLATAALLGLICLVLGFDYLRFSISMSNYKKSLLEHNSAEGESIQCLTKLHNGSLVDAVYGGGWMFELGDIKPESLEKCGISSVKFSIYTPISKPKKNADPHQELTRNDFVETEYTLEKDQHYPLPQEKTGILSSVKLDKEEQTSQIPSRALIIEFLDWLQRTSIDDLRK